GLNGEGLPRFHNSGCFRSQDLILKVEATRAGRINERTEGENANGDRRRRPFGPASSLEGNFVESGRLGRRDGNELNRPAAGGKRKGLVTFHALRDRRIGSPERTPAVFVARIECEGVAVEAEDGV